MSVIYCDKSLLPERREHDYYVTDPATVGRVLDLAALHSGYGTNEDAPTLLDPGAGSGVWGQAARKRWPKAHIKGVELRDVPQPAGYDEWDGGTDFLTQTPTTVYYGGFNLVVGNPPYRYAEEFVRVGMACLAPGGVLVYLLRLAFLEGQKRRDDLFCWFPPRVVAVCSKRPSFTCDGKTNSTAFAAFLWRRGPSPIPFPELTWL